MDGGGISAAARAREAGRRGVGQPGRALPTYVSCGKVDTKRVALSHLLGLEQEGLVGDGCGDLFFLFLLLHHLHKVRAARWTSR